LGFSPHRPGSTNSSQATESIGTLLTQYGTPSDHEDPQLAEDLPRHVTI